MLFFLLLVAIASRSASQAGFPVTGVLGEYPFLYYDNLPQTGVVMEDSVYCSVTFADVMDGNDTFRFPTNSKEFILHMHSVETLQIEGIAAGRNIGGTFTLYDSNRTAIRSVTGEMFPYYYDFGTGITDTHNYHKFEVLGCIHPLNLYNGSILRFNMFEKDSTVEISGDFYLGYRPTGIYSHGYLVLSAIEEAHDAPYHFADKQCYIDSSFGTWLPFNNLKRIPMLFPIIRPECVSVDSIVAVSDSAGCVSVDWEQLPIHSHWTVSMTGDDTAISETVDTCHLQKCGLAPGATYTVSIQSQCRSYTGDLYTSPWSDSVAVTISAPPDTSTTDTTGVDPGTDTTNVGIADADSQFTIHNSQLNVYPNPATGMVHIACTEHMLRAEVLDMAGRTTTIVETHGNKAVFDTSQLPKGVYTVRVTTPSGTVLKHLAIE